ncbi:fimbria/pilus outer membrane usher protein [Escherichia coli]
MILRRVVAILKGRRKQSDFVQAGYQYGFNKSLSTSDGGLMVANNYYAFTLGTGPNTRIGAISVDATKSHSKQDNGDVFDGQSYHQIAYNKFLSQTSTRFGLAAWRRYRRVIIGHLMITFGLTIKIIIAVMKTMLMTLPIITRTILAVKIAFLPI